jgi:hypothetical protein
LSNYTYSVTDDLFGKKYIEVANSRGNTVKLYKPKLGAIINKQFEQNFRFTTVGKFVNWIDRDNVMIEYSPNGEIISFMTRSHQATTNVGVDDDQYVNIYFGKGNAQFLENKIANNEFDNNFLRVINPVASKEFAPAPIASTSSPLPSQAIAEQGSSNNAIPKPSGVEVLIRPGKPDTLVAKQGDKLTAIPLGDSTKVSPEKRLQLLMQLGELKKSGVLNEQEFNAEKQRILGN